MIVRRIQLKDGGLPEVGPLLVEPRDQLLHEEAEGVGVGVGLTYRHVTFSLGADCRDDREPWRDGALLDGVAVASDSPFLVPEVALVERALVYVDHDEPLAQKSKHALSKLLADDEAPVRVPLESHLLDFSVAHLEPLAHDLGDEIIFDVHIMCQPNCVNNLLPPPNVLTCLDTPLDLSFNSHHLGKFLILFQLPLGGRIILLPKVTDEAAYKPGRNVERDGNFCVAALLNDHRLDNVFNGDAVYLKALPPFLEDGVRIIELLPQAGISWLLLLLWDVAPSQRPWHLVDDGFIEIIVVQVDV